MIYFWMAIDTLDILKHGCTYKGALIHNEINISLFFMLLNIIVLLFSKTEIYIQCVEHSVWNTVYLKSSVLVWAQVHRGVVSKSAVDPNALE